MQNSNINDILHPEQIKEIISKIVAFQPQQYASSIWFRQNQNLQKLNIQIHVNALLKTDQYILQQCVTQNKLKALIYDLILCETWKQKVIPLLKPDLEKLNSFKVYMSIYHQAVVCNLLEVVMYHKTAVQQSGEYLIQVIDYCYRQMVRQVNLEIQKYKKSRKQTQKKQLTAEQVQKEKLKKIINRTAQQQIIKQQTDIQFSLCMMAISITRYISDYIRDLQIGIIHHIIVECNIFALLIPLIEAKPWLRVNQKGQRQLFQNNVWKVLEKHEYGKLPKIQGQVWITIYNLFMEPECRKKYELTEQRKSTLLRLRKYMNQVLLDQIPTLSIMLRALQQLSLLNVPQQPINNPLIVQQVPQLKQKFLRNRNWKQLTISYKQRLSQKQDRQDMKRLAQLYSNSTLQGLIQGFKCQKCKKQAFKRCSKCKKVWYCSRQCQVADWKTHKQTCQIKVEPVQVKKDNNKINELD